eukprot:4859533-Pleurochrysis_carterae.AAC.6
MLARAAEESALMLKTTAWLREKPGGSSDSQMAKLSPTSTARFSLWSITCRSRRAPEALRALSG